MTEKMRSILILMLAEVAAMSLWFVSAAILPEMVAEHPISATRQAFLSSAVQAGFVVGALFFAIYGIPDRFDPRRVFAFSALAAAGTNAYLLVAVPGDLASILARGLTGALLAGVYPVGMKIAVGWGQRDRGFLVGALVGALTFGNALPHLFSLGGGADWRVTVALASAAAALAGIAVLFAQLGPHHAKAGHFDIRAISIAWTNRRVRLAYAGYLGHMWELFSMMAWIGVAATVTFSERMPADQAASSAKLLTFVAIAGGGVMCLVAGRFADRVGKARVAQIAMIVSAAAALGTAVTFHGPIWLFVIMVLLWGFSIIPDSAQFSALVADAAPPEHAGSLMTFQTALGFALTVLTVQMTPFIAAAFGWPVIFAIMALGPIFGIAAMGRLMRLD